jgi:hypothetical protein
MEIRKAELKDALIITEFILGCALDNEGLVLDFDFVYKGALKLIDNPKKGIFYLALVNKEPAGCLMITLQ